MGIKDIEAVKVDFNSTGRFRSWLLPDWDSDEDGLPVLYTAEQMQKFAINFAAFALKEGEPIDLVTSEDYLKHAEVLFKKYEEAQNEEV